MNELSIGERPLSIADIAAVARHARPVAIGAAARQRLAAARAVVEHILAEERVVYGVTTGFGQLATTRIPSTRCAGCSEPHSQSRGRGR